MIELDLENKIKENLANILSADECEIVGSWSPAEVGCVKGETDKSAKCVVSIFVQPRQHDAFSLPTVTVNGTVAMEFRVEQCPTMFEVSQTYDKVLTYFDDLHFDAVGFSEAYSADDFFATELMLNGGDKVMFDRQRNTWIVGLNFIIKGTVQKDLTSR